MFIENRKTTRQPIATKNDVAAARTLIRGCVLLDPDSEGRLLYNQDIFIVGRTIQQVGPHGTLNIASESVDTLIDGAQRLVIPGMINAHTHSLENMLKATSPSLPLELWLIPLFGDTIKWSPRFVYLSALLGAIEMLKSGTTGVLDHLWTVDGAVEPLLSATMEAYRDAGIRAAVAPAIEDQDLLLEAGKMRGITFPSHPFIDRFESWPSIERQVAHVEQFIATWHNTAEGRLRCLVGPSGIHWCSESLLQACNELAERYQTGMHLHAVETELQARLIHQHLSQGGIRYLREAGVLRRTTSLAHAIWLDEGDLDILAQTKSVVVHNPISNLRLGSGHFRLVEALEHGVTVALGSDGSASNDTQNMFDVVKLTGLMHNRPEDDYRSWPSPPEILRAATSGGAAALGMDEELGRIAPGYLADLVLLDMENSAFFPLHDPYLHLVYCEGGSSVDSVIINGQLVVEHGKVLAIDESALRQEIRALCKDVWQGFAPGTEILDNTSAVLTALDTLRTTLLQKEQV